MTFYQQYRSINFPRIDALGLTNCHQKNYLYLLPLYAFSNTKSFKGAASTQFVLNAKQSFFVSGQVTLLKNFKYITHRGLPASLRLTFPPLKGAEKLSVATLFQSSNKNISKKESFFQYLFVQYITNLTNNSSQKLAPKVLQGSEGLSKQLKEYSIKDLNFFTNSQSIQKGAGQPVSPANIFLNYKKPFLCYWLLPFLGLINVLPNFKTYKMATAIQGTGSPANVLNIPTVKFEVGSKNYSNAYIYSFSAKPAKLSLDYYFKSNQALGLDGQSAQRGTLADYHFGQSSRLENIKQVPITNLLKYKQKMDSLLLTTLENQKENYQLNVKNGDPENYPKYNSKFLNLSLAILNINLKLNSNLNWYWHNLFLGDSPDSPPVKNSNADSQPGRLDSLSVSNFLLTPYEELNKIFFPNKLFLGDSPDSPPVNKNFNQAVSQPHRVLELPLGKQNLINDEPAELFNSSLISNPPNCRGWQSSQKKEGTDCQSKRPRFSVSRRFFINDLFGLPDSKNLRDSQQISISALLRSNQKENLTLKGLDLQPARKDNYFVGVFKHNIFKNDLKGCILPNSYKQSSDETTSGELTVSQSLKTSTAGSKSSDDCLLKVRYSPYKSIKKALLLIDQALFEKSAVAPFFCPFKTSGGPQSVKTSSTTIHVPSQVAEQLTTLKTFDLFSKSKIDRIFSSQFKTTSKGLPVHEHLLSPSLDSTAIWKTVGGNASPLWTGKAINQKSTEPLEMALHLILKNKNYNIMTPTEIHTFNNNGLHSTKKDDINKTENIFFKKELLYNSIFEALKSNLNQILNNKTLINNNNNVENIDSKLLDFLSPNRTGTVGSQGLTAGGGKILQVSPAPNKSNIYKLRQKFCFETIGFKKSAENSLQQTGLSISQSAKDKPYSTDYQSGNTASCQFYCWENIQNNFLSGLPARLNILKLNFPIRGGNLSGLDHQSVSPMFKTASAPTFILPGVGNQYSGNDSQPKNNLEIKGGEKQSYITNHKQVFKYINQENTLNINTNQTLVGYQNKDLKNTNSQQNYKKVDMSIEAGDSQRLKNIKSSRWLADWQSSPQILSKTTLFTNSRRRLTQLEKNSFLFLSKYTNFLTTNIKKMLNPYKFRLIYLPEISINSLHPASRDPFLEKPDSTPIVGSQGLTAEGSLIQNVKNDSQLLHKNAIDPLTHLNKALHPNYFGLATKENIVESKLINSSTRPNFFKVQSTPYNNCSSNITLNKANALSEKIFLSYLSKAKKMNRISPPGTAGSLSAKITSSNLRLPMSPRINNKKIHSLTTSLGDWTGSQSTPVALRLEYLKLKSKINLRKTDALLLRTAPMPKLKKEKIQSGLPGASLRLARRLNDDQSRSRYQVSTIKISASAAQLLKTKLFISNEIKYLNRNVDSAPAPWTASQRDLKSPHRELPVSLRLPLQASSLGTVPQNIARQNEIEQGTESQKFIDILTKKQTLKVKRRLKKMKKETRRRKKRKIFYPRPMWITFSLYKNFLNNRYGFRSTALKSDSQPSNVDRQPGGSISFFSGAGSTDIQMRLKNKEFKQAQVQSLLTNTKDFYKTSSTVFRDLKRILMKSNWLRSYLNPYFSKVKNIYKEMENSTKRLEFYVKIRNFLLSFYGAFSEDSFLEHQTNENLNSIFLRGHFNEPHLKNEKLKQNLNNLMTSSSQFRTSNRFEPPTVGNQGLDYQSKRPRFSAGGEISVPLGQNRLNRVEYNRIVYQRIQRIILSIKENLNLNGEIKNRSKKLAKNIRAFIKRDYKSNGSLPNQPAASNENSSFWSKTLKNNILKVNTYISYGYNELSHNNTILNLSKNNLFWALNKTNISPSGSFINENLYSYPKKLWEIYKTREISKSNKTKKIIFNIFMKYGFLTTSSKSFDGYNHILEKTYNDNIANITTGPLRGATAAGSQLRSWSDPSGGLSPKSILVGEPILIGIGGDTESKTIPLKTYTVKSEQKLINIENKLKLLGLYSKKIEKTYKNAYFRSLKQQLSFDCQPKFTDIGSQSFLGAFQSNSQNKNYAGSVQKYQKSGMRGTVNQKGNRLPPLKNFKVNSQINTTFSNLNNFNKISNNYSYWWAFFKTNPVFATGVPQAGSPVQKASNKNSVPISSISQLNNYKPMFSLLFHFCTLVSFISLGGIKTLIKFYYILISKTSKLISQLSFIDFFRPSILFNNSQGFASAAGNKATASRRYPENGSQSPIDLNYKDTKRSSEGQKPVYNNIIKNSHISSRGNLGAKLFFLKCIISRNGEPKNRSMVFDQSRNINSTNLWRAKSTLDKLTSNVKTENNLETGLLPPLNKGWTTSKTKNNKLLEMKSNIANAHITILKDLREFDIRTSYFSSYFINNILRDSSSNWQSVNPTYEQQQQVANIISSKGEKGQASLYNNFAGGLSGLSPKYKMRLIYYSLLKLSNIFYVSHKISFYIYLLLLKSVDLFSVPISFIYKFFEKPGEYVVENIAYNFLVEWSADLITTIPDTVDVSTFSYFSKINRNISTASPLIILNSSFAFTGSWLTDSLGFPSLGDSPPANKNFLTYFFEKNIYFTPFLFSISNSILKRLLNSSLLIFIQQLCEPDLDYINRQKKGIIFWDIWGDYLKQVAEENSINIYELTTDKEEQIKLLSKYEEILSHRTALNDQLISSRDRSGCLINETASVNLAKQAKLLNTVSHYKAGWLPTQSLKPKSFKILWDNLINQTSDSPPLQLPTVGESFKEMISLPRLAVRSTFDISYAPKSNAKILQKEQNIYTRFGLPKNWGCKNNSFGWSVSQFLSYQGKDTDLFIDLHPPKSFWSIPSLKFSYSVHQPIGSIVCQIFSGIFYKQISKNILVVGSSGLEKSLLIQAMAGETELKIITDNANRYAMVYRGVAVGIKLLRDVFEALSVHTPCIFLMEDIHAIGERRPFLIDETSANDDASYNKNQSMQGLLLKEKSSGSEGAREVLYRSSKHLLSHYKKPYKEPKSLATNHFSFTFLFSTQMNLGGTKIRNNDFKPGGAALPVQVIKKENEFKYKNSGNMTASDGNVSQTTKNYMQSIDPFEIFSDALSGQGGGMSAQKNKIYSSALEINRQSRGQSPLKSQFLAPPASSPFSVLVLKEEKKLKHKKLIKETPWFGLPGEQYSLISKHNYSIRVKVALLADLVLSNLSVKLDMITDLLVIIDSVKGNRGFVVFATTHVPYILDPALRRPGRFDETINLPLISTLFTRWSNYRYNIKYLSTSLFSKYCIPLNSTFNKGITLDLFKYNLINNQQNMRSQNSNELINYLNRKNSISNKKLTNKALSLNSSTMVFNSSLNRGTDWLTVQSILEKGKGKKNKILPLSPHLGEVDGVRSSQLIGHSVADGCIKRISNKQLLKLKCKNYSFACKSLISLLLFTNSEQKGLNLGESQSGSEPIMQGNISQHHLPRSVEGKGILTGSPTSSLKWISMLKNSNFFLGDYSVYLTLFGYPLMLKIILMSLIGGKIGESFVLNSFKRSSSTSRGLTLQAAPPQRAGGSLSGAAPDWQSSPNSFLFNFDNTWKHASSLLFSYLQKRQCSILNKNVTLCGYSKGVNQLLSFNNKSSLMEPPSPPISNILLPSKRYENYKKTFNNQYEMLNNQNFFNGSIFEKLQLHQQQRLLRRLYKYPIKEFFKSEILSASGLSKELLGTSSASAEYSRESVTKTSTNSGRLQSNFNNSYLTLAPLEKTNLTKLTKLSSINWCYKNILYNRHRTYLTNQWWNGQQGEHNAETTFLSDIDWRYTFVQSIGDINIDFPDAEQFYNPRNRRWFLTSGDWNYWFDIQSELKDIYNHYIYDCFTKAYKYLNKNREIIDFYAEIIHQVPLELDTSSTYASSTGLNERELLNLYKRFFAMDIFADPS